MSKKLNKAAAAAKVSTPASIVAPAPAPAPVSAPAAVSEQVISEKSNKIIKRQSKCTTVAKGSIPNWQEIIVKGVKAFDLLDMNTGQANVKFKVIIELEPEMAKKSETVVVTQNSTVFNESILQAISAGESDQDDPEGITVDPTNTEDTGDSPEPVEAEEAAA
jgi:hypothetical protein